MSGSKSLRLVLVPLQHWFVELRAVLSHFQTQSFIGFFQFLDPLLLTAILSFQPAILALQRPGL